MLPDENQYDVKTHLLSSESIKTSFQKLFGHKASGFTLRFIRSDKDLKNVIKEGEIIFHEICKNGLHVNNAELYFSMNGKYFMIYMIGSFELRVYRVRDNDILRLMKDIELNNTIFVLNKFTINGKTRSLKFMQKIIFDRKHRFFALRGNEKIVIFNYRKLQKALARG